MNTMETRRKRFKLIPEMEGATARWYARNRGSANQLVAYRAQATQLTAELPSGADVLEVAPGPGYLAIEIARLGRFNVTGLDVARTFVELAGEQARRAGVTVDFRQGDVQDMALPDDAFDLLICQAAFKNFTQPVRALDEMHRVLRGGGVAIIKDLNRAASAADIAAEVKWMGLRRWNAFATRRTLAILKRRAYSGEKFERLAAESAFGGCAVHQDGISLEIRLTKPARA